MYPAVIDWIRYYKGQHKNERAAASVTMISQDEIKKSIRDLVRQMADEHIARIKVSR